MRLLLPLSVLLLVEAPGAGGELPLDAGVLNVRDFGAKGDGKTDDTESIKRAFTAVKRHYQLIYFPTGSYLVSERSGGRMS